MTQGPGPTKSTWIVWAQKGSEPVQGSMKKFPRTDERAVMEYISELLETHDLVGSNGDEGTNWHYSDRHPLAR